MTEAELLQFLQENKDDIVKSVKARAIEAMTEQVRWSLTTTVQETQAGETAVSGRDRDLPLIRNGAT